MAPSRQDRAERLRRRHEVRTVLRPTAVGGGLDLAYCRTGPHDGRTPVVVLPGGPGLASVVPYAALRARAARTGADLLMVEHRGVGLSRCTRDGADLAEADLRLTSVVDDVRAVLDAEGIGSAVLYGSSYGTYLALAFAVEHADRVTGLVLDSAVLGARDHHVVRAHARSLLWDGTPSTARLAAAVRRTGETRPQVEVDAVCRIVHEFLGPTALESLLGRLGSRRADWAWRRIVALSLAEVTTGTPFVMEYDLVGVIAHRELDYAPAPDGGPFDPGAASASLSDRFPAFEAEPYDLAAGLPTLRCPVVVVGGEWDLRTPPPVAERIVDLAPRGVLLSVPRTGHSLLDTRPAAALALLEAAGRDVAALPEATSHVAGLASRAPRMSLSGYLALLLRVAGAR